MTRTPWHATQRAAWEALKRAGEQRALRKATQPNSGFCGGEPAGREDVMAGVLLCVGHATRAVFEAFGLGGPGLYGIPLTGFALMGLVLGLLAVLFLVIAQQAPSKGVLRYTGLTLVVLSFMFSTVYFVGPTTLCR